MHFGNGFRQPGWQVIPEAEAVSGTGLAKLRETARNRANVNEARGLKIIAAGYVISANQLECETESNDLRSRHVKPAWLRYSSSKNQVNHAIAVAKTFQNCVENVKGHSSPTAIYDASVAHLDEGSQMQAETNRSAITHAVNAHNAPHPKFSLCTRFRRLGPSALQLDAPLRKNMILQEGNASESTNTSEHYTLYLRSRIVRISRMATHPAGTILSRERWRPTVRLTTFNTNRIAKSLSFLQRGAGGDDYRRDQDGDEGGDGLQVHAAILETVKLGGGKILKGSGLTVEYSLCFVSGQTTTAGKLIDKPLTNIEAFNVKMDACKLPCNGPKYCRTCDPCQLFHTPGTHSLDLAVEPKPVQGSKAD
ncbi:hypothetical protein NP233_g1921 [Leucocoprinus birnbaumii]|uniref:Uncharacterized protein n=1 Tax=Leucocoprinus birnbaumii TaxID=56174 RepID=A0AAD5VZ99_9AGAR|nr:hypothetical protein NP233_g1921 [Leucocoprinus birnbaumii]